MTGSVRSSLHPAGISQLFLGRDLKVARRLRAISVSGGAAHEVIRFHERRYPLCPQQRACYWPFPSLSPAPQQSPVAFLLLMLACGSFQPRGTASNAPHTAFLSSACQNLHRPGFDPSRTWASSVRSQMTAWASLALGPHCGLGGRPPSGSPRRTAQRMMVSGSRAMAPHFHSPAALGHIQHNPGGAGVGNSLAP